MISLRGLSDHTLKSYCTYIKTYFDFISNVLHISPEEASWDDMREYVKWLKKEKNLSDRTINAAISQLRFFTIYVLHKPWDNYQIPMRKFDTYLPFVPSQNEVKHFISTMPDIKQKAMVSLMYSSGLRIGEVCNLKYGDVNRRTMRIHISHSKNRFERYTILSKNSLDLLTEYWFSCGKPRNWLFPKQSGIDKPIDTFFLSRHIHNHEKRLGWPKRLTCHSFRHAFGTHLYENGVDLLTIKNLLGHKSLISTTVYVHLAENSFASVISPFDLMEGVSNGTK